MIFLCCMGFHLANRGSNPVSVFSGREKKGNEDALWILPQHMVNWQEL